MYVPLECDWRVLERMRPPSEQFCPSWECHHAATSKDTDAKYVHPMAHSWRQKTFGHLEWRTIK